MMNTTEPDGGDRQRRKAQMEHIDNVNVKVVVVDAGVRKMVACM